MEDKSKKKIPDSPACKENVSTTFNRDERRSASSVDDWIRSSLQTCSASDCLLRLETLMNSVTRPKDAHKLQKLKALEAVLEYLVTTEKSYVKSVNYQRPPKGFLTFQEAYDIFLGHLDFHVTEQTFRDNLLHEQHGLPVIIAQMPSPPYKRFVILKSPEIDLIDLFQTLTYKQSDIDNIDNSLSPEAVEMLIDSMDSEYDRSCARLLFASEKSLGKLSEYHMNACKIRDSKESILSRAEEYRNTRMAATDMLNLRLNYKQEKLSAQVKVKEQLIEKKQNCWPAEKITDIRGDVQELKDRLQNIANLQEHSDNVSKKKYNEAVKRTMDNLVEGERIKKRKTGAGAPRLIDSDTEEFVAKAIEDKATYHGRRHETTMFTNRRVKVSDLKEIANHDLSKRGKRTIHSAVTVWNRSRPRNKRSQQAKLHIGKSLFCTSKPPKAEDKDNESTHHQRAHVKNVYEFLFTEESAQFSFVQSMDDKAYVRPGTSEGCEKTRRVKILNLSGEGAKHLPKYDWPEKLVYATPSAHRIITKSATVVNGEQKLIVDSDTHFVIVRPKAIIDSSGTTWASEIVRLMINSPETFEIGQASPLSSETKSHALAIYAAAFQYKDMTMESDLQKVSTQPRCPHRAYERKRVQHLLNKLSMQPDQLPSSFQAVEDKREELKEVGLKLQAALDDPNQKLKLDVFQDVERYCSDMCAILLPLIPMIRPRVAHMTDAGPGVGVSNFEVRFRDAELARLEGSDYRIRVHRARGDSGQNEAERTNSASGDAIVDGSTIKWEYETRFQGMTPAEIKALSISEYHNLERERMENNAWKVVADITNRVDGAPVLSEYIRGLESEKADDHHFFNKDELKRFVSSSKQQSAPGTAYCEKIMAFVEQHYQKGELYMEYLKGSCLTKHGTLCSFCSSCPWKGPTMDRIPRPKPDISKLPEFHYLHVDKTPRLDEDSKERQPDDYFPRAQIKVAFQSGDLSLEDHSSIENFSTRFIVKESYVEEYVTHLQHLEWIKEMRSKDRQSQLAAKKSKAVEDYDWERMLSEGTIGKLTVPELNKYLEHHKLPLTGRKPDKIRTIAAHISSALLRGHASVHVHSDTEEEIENEEILQEVSDEECNVPEIRSRSGRTVRQRDYDDYVMY